MDKFGLCPLCSCNTRCIQYGNCCPEVFYALNISCVNPGILKGLWWNEDNRNPVSINRYRNPPVLMVTSCPQVSIDNEHNVCHVDDNWNNLIRNMPLTSLKTGLTYRNNLCSVCHNETPVDLLAWGIGTWKLYDFDIDHACQTYDNQFNDFKNIFCYLCNPPLYDGQSISTCNDTGLWYPYDPELEKLCAETTITQVIGNFKNIYCYFCNRNNDQTTQYNFIDVTYEVDRKSQFEHLFKIRKLSLKYILKMLAKKSEIENSSNVNESLEHFLTTPLDDYSNSSQFDLHNDELLDIYIKYLAYSGHALFCKNYSTFTELEYCDCDVHCSIRDRYYYNPCCIDKLIERSKTCTLNEYSLKRKTYMVYDDCSNFPQSRLQMLCKQNSNQDLLNILPVTSIKDDIPFKNIFCFLCQYTEINITFIEEQITDYIEIWEFYISCITYIPYIVHISFQEYFKFAMKNKCTIDLKPLDDTVECEDERFGQCNSTGKLQKLDHNIRRACELLVVPKDTENPFCKICNPEINTEIVYTTCNQTGLWPKFQYNEYAVNNCINLPEIEYHAPYKNVFCKECNNPLEIPEDYDIYFEIKIKNDTHIDPTYIFLPTFRVLFSLLNYERTSTDKIFKEECRSDQLYNSIMHTCSDLTCFPGRVLRKNACVPLLEITYGLGYILTLGLEGVIYNDNVTSAEFLQSVKVSFISHITNITTFSQQDLLILRFRSSCSDELILKRGDSISLSIYLKMSFPLEIYVNRTLVEENLLKLTNSTIDILHGNFTYKFTVTDPVYPLLSPETLKTSPLNGTCFIYSEEGTRMETYILVSELLICKQVELKDEGFTVENDTRNLVVGFSRKKLSPMKYILTPTNRARICKDDYEWLINEESKSSIYKDVSGIVLMICTCISLVCLFLTFLTYLIFPSLRTVPGKINMSLVFAMFCSHTVYQFGLYQTNNQKLCSAIGILIHYLWLATFGCLNVCSFHMYRMFSSICITRQQNEIAKQKRTILLYLLYSYGMPFLIVSCNVGLTSIVDSDNEIGYGGHVCFLNQQISIIITFIAPIVLVCCSNVALFSLTARTIASSCRVTDEQLGPNRNQFTVYVKLFTITGITWIFQIVESFLPSTFQENAFSMIVWLLNALQGVFIFVSFICNRKTVSLYKGKMRFSKPNSRALYTISRTTRTHSTDL
ncbi:Hypothetical predicted protein [Mytilus galloprovincialis]|uniref:G-protein coupled receptors family 2 profile 2 domain-containing protein n=1 Tax=Mytilus galloprovincialis TaxID=29158 RepID=A0A8B6FE53_MYTGA|nr:Hypothetical predicted protein [Mytilus galloprovincialis]